MSRAPADCFQYHTGIFGNIQSFNFANGQMLSSQAYRICFRQELDYCSITYTASLVPSPDSFELLTSNAGTTTTVGNCKTNYVGIPQGGDTGQMDSRAQRYCGKYFDSSDSATRNGQVTCEVPFLLTDMSNCFPFQPRQFHLICLCSRTPHQLLRTNQQPQVTIEFI